MTFLDDMRDMGMRVNWRTLLVGLEGPGKHPPTITLGDVSAFASEQHATRTTAESEDVVAVLVASSDDAGEAREILQRLAEKEESDPERELRKWRLVLLRQAMMDLPADPLYGLIALTEFWERFDFPADSPHVVQGRGNRLDPSAYYTKENYLALVQKHRDWAHREATSLRS